jgi:hypothetical protein
VLIRNDEHMARIDRLNIEKGGALIITIDYARGGALVQDATEDTVGHRWDLLEE